jgi:hypothetical protein
VDGCGRMYLKIVSHISLGGIVPKCDTFSSYSMSSGLPEYEEMMS